MGDKSDSKYLHGYSDEEKARLYRQARVLEHRVHGQLPFRRSRDIVEIGSGVGAQTEILLRHFPDLHVTCVERSQEQIVAAENHLGGMSWLQGRFNLVEEDAMHLGFEQGRFDGAFLCWVLEHVPSPARVLSETRRILKPGSPIVCTEVINSSFFINPYSPQTLKYWLAFNDHQIDIGGDPFVGSKLGNLLQSAGFRDIETEVRTFHFDNRAPGERAEFLSFWTDLLLSGAPELLKKGRVSEETVDGMREELDLVGRAPDSVFLYSFMRAVATA
ncbi:MAG: ubiquinone/menaquinone biosynthesis C-methylase UbiE [Planctomycetota bacterium]|jgi:ubiquinone/menaquinone biosynthesis C-methylase UbiE